MAPDCPVKALWRAWGVDHNRIRRVEPCRYCRRPSRRLYVPYCGGAARITGVVDTDGAGNVRGSSAYFALSAG